MRKRVTDRRISFEHTPSRLLSFPNDSICSFPFCTASEIPRSRRTSRAFRFFISASGSRTLSVMVNLKKRVLIHIAHFGQYSVNRQCSNRFLASANSQYHARKSSRFGPKGVVTLSPLTARQILTLHARSRSADLSDGKVKCLAPFVGSITLSTISLSLRY